MWRAIDTEQLGEVLNIRAQYTEIELRFSRGNEPVDSAVRDYVYRTQVTFRTHPMAAVNTGYVCVDLERPLGKRRQAQPADDATDIRPGQHGVGDDSIEVRQVLGRAVNREAHCAQGQVEVRNDVLAVEKILPGPELAVGPERQIVDGALHIEIQDIAGIRQHRERLDRDVDRPRSCRVDIGELDAVDPHLPERKPIGVEFVVGIGFPPCVPVAATIAEQFDPTFHVANVKFFYDEWATEQCPRVDHDGQVPDTKKLHVGGPVRVGQRNVLGDEPAVTAELELEASVDIQLVAERPRDVALDLLFVNRKVGVPQVDIQRQRQDDYDSQRPDGDAEDLAHRSRRLRAMARGRYRTQTERAAARIA